MPKLLDNICRTCLLYNAVQSFTELEPGDEIRMVSIFSVHEIGDEENLSLTEIIKNIFPQLTIKENDQLPKYVCNNCLEKIMEIYNFQLKCIRNEEKFRKLLEEGDISELFNKATNETEIVVKDQEAELDYFKQSQSIESTTDEIVMENMLTSEYSNNSSDRLICDENNESIWEESELINTVEKEKVEKRSSKISTKKVKERSSSKRPTKSRQIKSKLSLIKHHELHMKKDNEERELKCNVCNQAFEEMAIFKEHQRTHTETNRRYDDDDDEYEHFNTKQITLEQLYPCDRCKRKLKSKLSLKKHQEMHTKRDNEEPKFMCNICDRGFPQGNMLKDHLRWHSDVRPYLCSECGKSFISSGCLKQHSFRHLNEKQFPCPDCPKSFLTRTDLASHSDVHKARPRIHVCDICGRGFPKPFLLKKHQMYHTNDRPFSCECCGKRFVTNEKLQRHVRIHTGEKPYKCSYCEKAYCQSSELTKHLRIHLGDNVYQCQLCPLRFRTVKVVREHFSTHKNDDAETKVRNLAELNALTLKGIYCR